MGDQFKTGPGGPEIFIPSGGRQLEAAAKRLQDEGMSGEDRLKVMERCLDDGARQVDGLNGYATSADIRAVTVASVFFSAATAILAGSVAWAAQAGGIPHAVAWSGGVACLMLYVAAAACLWTALPEVSFVSGNPPDFWQWHLDQGSTYVTALESQVAEYERKISDHRLKRRRAGRIFRAGAIAGALAPVMGLVTYLLAVRVFA